MSDPIRAGQKRLIVFALVDTDGDPVAGLGTAFVLTISKNGGAFGASTGTKAEISGGWYSYELTAAETDTVGPLAVKVTGAGAVQQNLSFQVDWAAYAAPAGTYILTATEASDVLRCAIDDPVMLALLPAVDAYIEMATGRDWAADATIREEAKSAARILLVQWHEDPGMMGSIGAVLSGGLTACLTQLEALALELKTEGIPDEYLKIMKSMPKDGDDEMAITISPVIIFNHEMAAGATICVVLQTAAGVAVAGTNTLDATGKILTVDPTASLTALTSYNIVITAAPDVYGQTITETIGFRTA